MAAVTLHAADTGTFVSHYSAKDFALTADPKQKQWRDLTPVKLAHYQSGEPVAAHDTEVRSRWTEKNLYLLFRCSYETLYLNDSPKSDVETPKLWDHDVAEAFIGWDASTITRYKEFQVSPQGEFIDLDIDRIKALPNGGADWNSGYKVKARLDREHKVWYGEMQIPWSAIDERPVKAGNTLRLNMFRLQGPPPNRTMMSWQTVTGRTYHQPERFGKLELAK